MKKLLIVPFVLFTYFLFAGASSSKKEETCIVTRAAFDIGSGASKMRVLKVDRCKQLIVSKIEGRFCQYSEKVAYKEDLKINGKISRDIINKGVRVLKAMMIHAKKCGATQFAGSATSAFRQASNAQEAIDRLNITGANIQVISQNEEAKLGYRGAIAKLKADKTNSCVWDIGGSSMQFVCPGELIYLGHLASVPFKHKIIQLQKSLKVTPNPVSEKDYKLSSEVARGEASKVKKAFHALQLNKLNFIGIGGVHYNSISKVINKSHINLSDLENEIKKRLNKTNEQLGSSKYVDTYVSNIILVKAMMEGLGITSLEVANVNLSEGLSVSEPYWSNN